MLQNPDPQMHTSDNLNYLYALTHKILLLMFNAGDHNISAGSNFICNLLFVQYSKDHLMSDRSVNQKRKRVNWTLSQCVYSAT
jgi:hypothetical protein